MGNKNMKFTNQHAIQYTNISSDLRFYAEQRFKIAGVFMITNGILANIASERHNILLGLIGIALGYLCLSWENVYNSMVGNSFEGLKTLEKTCKRC